MQTAGFYKGPIDGIYGPQTVAAVEQLQTDSGLPVTGLVDQATALALDKKLAKVGLQTAALQSVLKLTGNYTGPIDGKWTPELTDALKQFQTDAGLPPTGAIDAATLAALEQALAEIATTAATTTTTTTAPGSPTTAAAETTGRRRPRWRPRPRLRARRARPEPRHRPRAAEVDGNRTRRTGSARPSRFEGGGAHQVPGHLRWRPYDNGSPYRQGALPSVRVLTMKKILVLLVLVGLVAIAAKKVRTV